MYHWFDKETQSWIMINHVTYHLKMPKFPEFHAFSKIAPGIEHLAFSTRENVNTRTSTSLGQEISRWESDRGTPPPKTGGWQQPLSQSSCLASCHASCETNKSWTAGSKCLKTGKFSRQHGKKKNVDIHWMDHIKYLAKKLPCFQISIYPPCAWAPVMRHRHRDECVKLCTIIVCFSQADIGLF